MTHTTIEPVGQVDVYSVGILRDLEELRRVMIHPRPTTTATRRRVAAYRLRIMWRDKGRRSYWNGYLAEPLDGAWMWDRCGHGWTRRRALRSLRRNVDDTLRRRLGELIRERVAA